MHYPKRLRRCGQGAVARDGERAVQVRECSVHVARRSIAVESRSNGVVVTFSVDARFVHDGLNDEQSNKCVHSVIKLKKIKIHQVVIQGGFCEESTEIL